MTPSVGAVAAATTIAAGEIIHASSIKMTIFAHVVFHPPIQISSRERHAPEIIAAITTTTTTTRQGNETSGE